MVSYSTINKAHYEKANGFSQIITVKGSQMFCLCLTITTGLLLIQIDRMDFFTVQLSLLTRYLPYPTLTLSAGASPRTRCFRDSYTTLDWQKPNQTRLLGCCMIFFASPQFATFITPRQTHLVPLYDGLVQSVCSAALLSLSQSSAPFFFVRWANTQRRKKAWSSAKRNVFLEWTFSQSMQMYHQEWRALTVTCTYPLLFLPTPNDVQGNALIHLT